MRGRLSQSPPLVLTARDREILETLARCVRTLSLEQIARTWWPDTDDVATRLRRTRSRVRDLVRARLVVQTNALAHPELSLSAPVITWAPGEPEPDIGPAAYRLRRRWSCAPAPVALVTIANAAAPEFGGYAASALRTDELTHDLHLAAVFLHYRATAPECAAAWIGERVIRKICPGPPGPVPDAMIRSNSAVRFVEFGGAYSAQRVRTIHDHCAARGAAYEVW